MEDQSFNLACHHFKNKQRVFNCSATIPLADRESTAYIDWLNVLYSTKFL